MTEHLIRLGHRQIAFLADGNPPMGVDAERLAGYKEALRAYSLPVKQEDYIFISHKAELRWPFLHRFAKQAKMNYTALFFSSDFYAVDAIHIFSDEGVCVPQDISICGFDDNIFATQCRPQLTTVRQNVSEKAVFAVKQLLRLICREGIEQDVIRLKTMLVVRDSVAAPTNSLAK